VRPRDIPSQVIPDDGVDQRALIPLLADAFFVAMAVTIIAGLLFATLLTMIVVPVLYAMMYQVSSAPVPAG